MNVAESRVGTMLGKFQNVCTTLPERYSFGLLKPYHKRTNNVARTLLIRCIETLPQTYLQRCQNVTHSVYWNPTTNIPITLSERYSFGFHVNCCNPTTNVPATLFAVIYNHKTLRCINVLPTLLIRLHFPTVPRTFLVRNRIE
jgi:hypothetical protein